MTIQTIEQAGALAEQMEYARTVASASILPEHYRNRPADVMIAMGLGQAMGLSRVESLYRIAVIKGKPTASAELIASNVRKAGHRLRTRLAEDGRSATASIWRADDPDFEHSVTRDLAWAQSMGLANNDNYKKQLATMLANRAITAVARLACPEALYGVSYSSDEMSDLPGEAAPAQPTTSASRLRGALGVTVEQVPNEADVPGTEAPVVPGSPAPEAPEPSPLDTRSNLAKAMYAGINEAGIPEADRIEFINGTIGREVTSTKEMTENEARIVLDALAAMPREPAS